MDKWIHEKFKALIGGGALGVFASIHFLWTGPIFGNVVIFFILKLVGTGLLAATSAIFTALGTDLWKHKIKPFFQKKKKNGE